MTPYRVLFLCNANACRSIMAEAALNALGGRQFQAYSAGSQPRGEVHPVTLDVLNNAGFTVDGLHSKSWHTFESDDAPHMDLVISVCDRAAHEICPSWPGHPLTGHWGFRDPALVAGSAEDIYRSFDAVLHEISARVRLLVNLPPQKIDTLVLRTLGQPSQHATAQH